MIVYHPKIHHALSRHSHMAPCLGELAFDHQTHTLLGLDHLQVMATNAFKAPTDSTLISSIRSDLDANDFTLYVLTIIPITLLVKGL